VTAAGRRAFVLVYALSGAAGLVYEVAWTRLLTLQLGHTVAAASTVLAAFMGGLAIGAWVAGGLLREQRTAVNALRTYAALEIIVALAALLVPAALGAFLPTLAWAYADGTAPTRFLLVRVGLSLALVGLPAAAMGATFPIATAAAATVSADAARLYAANTAGAAVGAVAAGFWLLPALGLRGTTWVGVGLNVAAAVAAIAFAGRLVTNAGIAPSLQEKAREKQTRALKAKPRPTPAVSPKSAGLAALAVAVSGFCALVYEVAWTRLVALVIGPTTYAFATMAASFITGLAAGAAIGTRVARRTSQADRWLGLCLAAAGMSAVITAWYTATVMPLSTAARVTDPSVDFSTIVWQQAVAVGFVLLPMTLALGAVFPLALEIGSVGGALAKETASVYAANTVGAIAGALCAGFLLIPALGLRDTIRFAGMTGILGSAVVLLLARRTSGDAFVGRSTLTGVTVSVAAALIVLAVPAWDPALLASGAYKYAPYLAGTDLEVVLRAGRLQYYKEGAAGTVSVRDLTGTRSLAIDGKVDASNSGDMLTQRLLALLPILIHGHAEDVGIIGLGSGVTAGTALAVGTVRRVDVVEISPEVVEASRFFERENGNVLANPKVTLIVGDGRSHLQQTSRQYDVLVSEPSNPWMAGVASLFTREFFEAARNRLKPDGVICQWAHTYDIHPDDLRSIIRTFGSVFPQGSMWLVGGGDLLLIGARSGDLSARFAAIPAGAAAPSVQAALVDVGAPGAHAGFTLLSLFAGGPADLDRFATTAAIQIDDRTALEYSAPRGIYGRSRDDNVTAIRALDADSPPAIRSALDRADDRAWAARGTMDLRAQAFATAYEAFRRAVAGNSRNIVALSGLSDAAGAANKLDEERQWLAETAAREPSNAEVRIELSRVLIVTGDPMGAVRAASEALEIAPTDPRAAEQLASVFADTGDHAKLARLSEQLVSRFPEQADSWYYQATTLFLAGRHAEAITAVRTLIAAHPDHNRAQGLLGASCAAAGQRECAQMAFDASIRDSPRDPSRYVNAGLFQLQIAKPSAAEGYFASALAVDPSSQAARQGLAQTRALLAKR
jgi:spermidine synthase